MGLLPYQRAGSPGQNNKASSTAKQGETGTGKNPGSKPFTLSKLLAFGIPILLLFALGCTKDLQSTFDPLGPVAAKQLQLFNVLLWTMVIVFVLVEGILIYTIIRFRRQPGREPSKREGHLTLEIAWTIIPTILVLGLGIWSVFTLFEIAEPPDDEENVLEVIVTGHQWWFEFEYPDAGGGKRITTANELRIPVDRAVQLRLRSDDVIHSFWVPKLAGKLDMVPTRTNSMWFKADSSRLDSLPATLYGQCAELCGVGHALMRFRVEVLSEEDYAAWVEGYSAPPAETPKARQGQTVFNTNCSLCHTINGGDDTANQQTRLDAFLTSPADSISPVPAPNLSDLRTRKSLAAGLEDLTAEKLREWLHNPEDIKPGNLMSNRAIIYRDGDTSLSDEDVEALIAYLLNLP